MTTAPVPNAFGSQLRYWRRLRGLSQLGLALEANTTPRHLSFLETGRSRPGSDIVLRLADALDMPLRERNHLLAVAGLPPAYDDATIDAPDLTRFRRVLDRMLAAHAPFPGFVFDLHWNIIAATPIGEHLLAGSDERNMVRLLFAPDGAWREVVDNWDRVAAYALSCLQDDALRFPHDEQLRALHDMALAATSGTMTSAVPVASPRLRLGTERIDTISVISQFSSPRHATVQELRIELLHPADDRAEHVLRQLAHAVQDTDQRRLVEPPATTSAAARDRSVMIHDD